MDGFEPLVVLREIELKIDGRLRFTTAVVTLLRPDVHIAVRPMSCTSDSQSGLSSIGLTCRLIKNCQ